MKVTSCSCLLAFLLHCTVNAEIIHEVLEEKQSVTLLCSHSVEGKVTWSRETDGDKTDLLTSDGDRLIKHIKDPQKRYSSLADHSLYIRGVKISDTGRYFCDNEAAVELTVIPSGTVILTAAERTSVTLTCPHDVGGSHVPTWSRNFGEIQQQPVNKMLIITDVKLSDSGLYSCDGKPAVYLKVIKGDQTDRGSKAENSKTSPTTSTAAPPSPTTKAPVTWRKTDVTTKKRKKKDKKKGQNTPSTTSRAPTSLSSSSSSTSSSTSSSSSLASSSASSSTSSSSSSSGATTGRTTIKTAPEEQKLPLVLIVGVAVSCLLLIIILIVYFTWRRKFKRRGNADSHHVYDEIQDGLMNQRKSEFSTYHMAEFTDGSNQNDATYSTIPDHTPMENSAGNLVESPYSLICDPSPKGPSKPTDSTYCYLQNPKEAAQNTGTHL